MASPFVVVSSGDVLQLCQQAWKLQYTFKSDKAGIPQEFAEVEAELEGLTKALSAVSEALDEDQSLLLVSNTATRNAAIIILESCQRTLHELEILVASYQDVKKVTRSDGSRTIDRQWRPIFIRNYLTTIWTNEGGDIYDLRSILNLHVQSIVFFYEAIKLNDKKLLEFILPPVAQDVQQIHAPFEGTEKMKIREIQGDLDSLARKFNSLSGSPRNKGPAFDIVAPQFHYGANTSRPRADASREWLTDTKPDNPPLVPPRSASREIRNGGSSLEVMRPSTSTTQDNVALPVSPPARAPGSYRLRSNTNATNSSYSGPPPYEQQHNHHEVDSISHNLDRIELASNRGRHTREPSSKATFTASVLPRSIVAPTSPQAEDPFHQIRMLGRTPPGEANTVETSEIVHQKAWRDTLFKHAAVLYDKKCSLLEFTKPNGKRQGDFLMEKAFSSCQVYIITKGTKSTTGTLRYHTSIWVISNDGETVMEQRLPDDREVIPYTIWDNHTKIVLREQVELRFFGKQPDDRPERTVRTGWVNYVFENEPVATEFQNVLLGKKLLASIRTRKTTRLHAGMTGAFSNQQQLCALENLRIFQDDNTGLVYGMIHFVPEFSTGNGYMTFALNDTKHPIRVKEDSATAIKIKGMTMSIKEGTRRPSTSSDPSRASKKGQDVLITGAKLEFYAKSDKVNFMSKLIEIQDSGTLAHG